MPVYNPHNPRSTLWIRKSLTDLGGGLIVLPVAATQVAPSKGNLTMSTQIMIPEKEANILGTAVAVEFLPTKPTAKMFPCVVNGATGEIIAHGCSRHGCTTPVKAGDTLKAHPSSGKLFHDVSACNGTLSKDLPKAPKVDVSALAAERDALAERVRNLEAALAAREATGKVTSTGKRTAK